LHYLVGEPIHLDHGPEAAEDEEIVAELHQQVTEATQSLIDRGLSARGDVGTDADADLPGGAPHEPERGAVQRQA
jgi:hypothetical protein